ncbi:hypothetical protein J3R82DRAFT_1866 [Butyriboletus roseoflavus]|nr:hypothetical protein J3R82DRAFT_1866 [Butyriboletus roseoflavus]
MPSLKQTDVDAASNVYIDSSCQYTRSSWGGQVVLLLIDICLRIDSINHIYYKPIKVSSIALAPNLHMQMNPLAGAVHVPPVHQHCRRAPLFLILSYGPQADNLFYLAHYARPIFPFRPTPPSSVHGYSIVHSPESTSDSASDHHAPTFLSFVKTGSLMFSYYAPLLPSPLQYQPSMASSMPSSSVSSQHPSHWQNASVLATPSPHFSISDLDLCELGVEEKDLDVVANHHIKPWNCGPFTQSCLQDATHQS